MDFIKLYYKHLLYIQKVIEKKLKKLCASLPQKWKLECTQFIGTKFETIIDMIVAQVEPEELCVLLEVCKPKAISKSADNDIGK